MSTGVSESRFTANTWFNALTVKERAASLASAGFQIHEASGNVAAAKRRLKKWRSQAPFTKEEYFVQRLGADSLTEEQFLRVLAAPVQSLIDSCGVRPAWLVGLEQAFTAES